MSRHTCRVVAAGVICRWCHSPRSVHQMGHRACLHCESVLADEVLFHIYGEAIMTMDCVDCHSTYVLRPGITVDMATGDCFCPWCELGVEAADMEVR